MFGDNVRFTEADYLRCHLPVGVQPSSTATARSIMRTHSKRKRKESKEGKSYGKIKDENSVEIKRQGMKRVTRKEKESARNTPPLRLFNKGTTNKGKVTIKKHRQQNWERKKNRKSAPFWFKLFLIATQRDELNKEGKSSCRN